MIGHRATSQHELCLLIVISVMATAVQLIDVVMATADPRIEVIKQTNAMVAGLLQDKDSDQSVRTGEQRQRLVEEVGKRYSCEEMSKRSLGDYWGTLDDRQRQEFRSIFQTLLAKSYVGAIAYFSKIHRNGGEPVQYLQEGIANEYAEVLVEWACQRTISS